MCAKNFTDLLVNLVGSMFAKTFTSLMETLLCVVLEKLPRKGFPTHQLAHL
jgi:hypothetical protein